MATMHDVRAAIDPEEPDYPRAAAELGTDALPFLLELSRDSDTMVASKAVSLAGLIGGTEAVRVIESGANADAAEVRVVASVAAGRLGTDGEPILLNLLADGDVGVRRYAVRAAGDVMSDAVRETLLQMRVADSDPRVRQQVADTLGPDA